VELVWQLKKLHMVLTVKGLPFQTAAFPCCQMDQVCQLRQQLVLSW